MFKKTFLFITLCFSCATWAQGIYTCVDAKGRRITADRPIAECIDRSQKEMTPSGYVKRTIGPSLTAKERIAQEQKEKAEAEVLARQVEEKRRNRALLVRYPTRAVHDKERSEALAQVDEVIKLANKRTNELRQRLQELSAAAPDPTMQPRRDEIQSNINVQLRFIEGQEAEKTRINARFDDELSKLNYLWTVQKETILKVNSETKS